MVWLLVLALLFALLVAVFALQNAAVIVIQFFTWRVEVSLVLLVLVSTIVGALIVGLAAMVQRLRLGRQVRHLEGRIRELERALKAAGPASPPARAEPPRPASPPIPPPAPEEAPDGSEPR